MKKRDLDQGSINDHGKDKDENQKDHQNNDSGSRGDSLVSFRLGKARFFDSSDGVFLQVGSFGSKGRPWKVEKNPLLTVLGEFGDFLPL